MLLHVQGSVIKFLTVLRAHVAVWICEDMVTEGLDHLPNQGVLRGIVRKCVSRTPRTGTHAGALSVP